ncbi:MAG: hypothetical protein A3F10_01900 [Coxiella sp. RIFCSPHIGHO2_12_FULL_42_15]|nr:MAG: hypothetical protein A3F10_01900 [Coxiella sp. RIFCSPHIGHO2_12_FULL_42_15]
MTPFLFALSTTITLVILLPHSQKNLVFYVVSFAVILIVKIYGWRLGIFILMGVMTGWICTYWQSLRKPFSSQDFDTSQFISGEIISIPQYLRHHLQFDFLTTDEPHYRVRLNWYGWAPDLRAGDRWQLQIKIKNSISLNKVNYVKTLQAQNIQYQGYVLDNPGNHLLQRKNKFSSIDALRQDISAVIYHATQNHSLAAVLAALTTGSRHLLSMEDWQVFQNTGTSHLIAISGLHVSLVAGLIFWLVKKCGGFFPKILLLIPSQKIAALIALWVAILYSILAGMSLPTERALIMLAIVLLSQMLHRHTFLWYRLLMSFTVIVVIWPYAVESISFWLSFFAVAMLGYLSNARLQIVRGFWEWIRFQLLLFIALLPLTLLFFARVSLVMIPANLIAIPYVSFIVVPVCLVAAVGYFLLPQWDHYLWLGAAKCLQPLWWYLATLAGWPHIIWQHPILHSRIFIDLLLGTLLFLAPKGFPGKILAPCFALPLFFYDCHAG